MIAASSSMVIGSFSLAIIPAATSFTTAEAFEGSGETNLPFSLDLINYTLLQTTGYFARTSKDLTTGLEMGSTAYARSCSSLCEFPKRPDSDFQLDPGAIYLKPGSSVHTGSTSSAPGYGGSRRLSSPAVSLA
jgi:hypothetical protein